MKWFKDGVAISYGQNTTYRLAADGTLIITKVKDGDAGRYTCMAQNYLGQANKTAPGTLLGKKFLTITVKFSRVHWLIFIVNKRTDT